MPNQYTVYGSELSLFTRKLEAGLVFYNIPFTRIIKTQDIREDIEKRSGTHQIPVLQTPENWMIGDTTPLLMLLDSRFPARALFPAGPLGVLVHIVEEYLDEWVARVMVHYRWHYEDSSTFAVDRMVREQMPGADEATIAATKEAFPVAPWGVRACRATGTESAHQQRAAEEEYERLLTAVDKQLQHTRYLLGDRPCAVDTIVLGGLRAHTNMDPAPKRRTARYPRVLQWCEQNADQWDGSGELAPFPASTPFAQTVLAEMKTTYQPYILANAAAQVGGKKAFVVETYGEDVSYLSRPYPERSRQMIVDRIANQLNAEERPVVTSWLKEAGLEECFR